MVELYYERICGLRCCIGSWCGNWRESDHWENLCVFVCIIVGWILGEGWVYSVLLGKPEGKRPLGKPSRRLMYNIRMDLWGEAVYRLLEGKPVGKIELGCPRL